MVTISKQDNAIIFAFTDSQYYLFGTGSIEVPMNALSLVIDESDMITFRKASSNDIFVSIPLDETNFSTKADVIDFYKENMVGSSGSADAFTGVSYDGTNQEIIFTNKDDEEVATLDASAFVIDGMVENVKVENGYLVIDFNTASGKQDIYIPLTSFFDASQYYTKTEVDNTFLTIAAYNPKEQAIAEALTDLHENKADKTELPDVSTLATKTELNAKQDALVSGTNIKTVNNESILGAGNIEIQGGGGGMDEDTELLISSALVDLNDRKIDTTEVKEKYQKKGDYATNAKVDTKANISDVPTNEDYEEAQKITSWSLNDLNKNKADKTEIPDISNYYTKTEIDAMIGNINTILASI